MIPWPTLDDSYTTTPDYETYSKLSFHAVADTIPVKMPSATDFLKYRDLPTELRRQIVQEAAKPLIVAFKGRYVISSWHKKDSDSRGPFLAQYACLDSIWKEVIEQQTFQHLLLTLDDIKPFAAICKKRRGVLRHISVDLHEGSWPPQFRANGGAGFNSMKTLALYTLFGIMKDWDPAEGNKKASKSLLMGDLAMPLLTR